MHQRFSESWAVRWVIASVILAGVGSLPSGMIFAQDSSDVLLQRIDHLEQNLETVQRQLYRGSIAARVSPSGDSNLEGGIAARFQQQLVDMDGVIANLTGQVEEVRFELSRIHSRLEKLITDIDYRLSELREPSKSDSQASAGRIVETTTKIAGAGRGEGNRTERESIATFNKLLGQEEPINGPAKAPVPNSKGSAKEHYESISVLLSQGDYIAAERLLLAFLEVYPEDPLAGNAQYWLGETYYVRGDFQHAAVAFAQGYRKYAKSSKAPANVLKLGISLAKLERVQDACTAFNRLAIEFPNASGDLKQRAALEKKRLGCK